MMTNEKSFDELLASVKVGKKEETTFTIALGDYFEGSDDILTFRKLPASLFFSDKLKELFDALKFQRCEEDDMTIVYIAMIIACHVAPEASAPGVLLHGYKNIFAAFSEVQKLQFIQEFEEKSGGALMANAVRAIADKKKGIGTEGKPRKTASNGNSSATPSATSNATRPKRPSTLKTSKT